jgi:predicted amidohydrolase
VRIALVQQRSTADRAANRARGLEALERAARGGAELVCYAELAFDPFYPQERAPKDVATLAEAVPGPTTEVFAERAARLGVAVVLNLLELDGDLTYDSSPVIDADGTLLGAARMVHVPDFEGFHERGYYAPGDRGAPVFRTRAGAVGVAICYDRHFPEYMRALAIGGAEIVVVPQAGAIDEWPEGLFEAEMRTAAFQNGYFTALANRVGAERRLTFAGESFVCDPAGTVIARAARGADEILSCDLDLDLVRRSHARTLFLPDRRPALYGDWLAADAGKRRPGRSGAAGPARRARS